MRIKKSVLENVLRPCVKVAGKRTTLPVLSHILVSSSDRELTVSASNLEQSIKTSALIDSDEKMSVLVPAGIFMNIIDSLDSDTVNISVSDTDIVSTVNVSCGSSSYDIVSLPPNEFPMPPVVVPDATFKIAGTELLRAIEMTKFAVSRDESRAILMGVLFHINTDSELRLVSTDTHRLCVYKCQPVSAKIDTDIKKIVPIDAIIELSRCLSGDTVTVEFSNNFAKFVVGNTVLITRLIDGTFPAYERVIPASFKSKLDVETDALIDVLKRIQVISNTCGNRAIFDFSPDGVKISAESMSVGKATELVPGKYDGEPLRIGINSRYMLDALTAFTSKMAEISLNNSVSQIKVVPTEQDNYIYIVMPMNLDQL